jgi:hypothetical protein
MDGRWVFGLGGDWGGGNEKAKFFFVDLAFCFCYFEEILLLNM